MTITTVGSISSYHGWKLGHTLSKTVYGMNIVKQSEDKRGHKKDVVSCSLSPQTGSTESKGEHAKSKDERQI